MDQRPPRAWMWWLAGIALLGYGIDWGLPAVRCRAPDNLVLDGRWAEEGRDLSTANTDKYPPLVYLHMEAAFVVVRPIVRAWFVDPLWRASAFLLAARATSAVCVLLAAALVGAAAARRGGPTARLPAAMLLLVSPLSMYYARTSNAEAGMLLYVALAWYALERYRADASIWAALLAGVAVGCAAAAKDQAAFALVGPLLVTLAPCRGAAPTGGGRCRALGAACAAALGAYALVYGAWGGWPRLVAHYHGMTTIAEGFYAYGTSPTELGALLLAFGRDLAVAAGPIALLAVLAVRARASDGLAHGWLRACGWSIVPYALSILFLAHRTYPRFALPLLPPLAALAGVELTHLFARRPRVAWAVSGAAVLWGFGIVAQLAHAPVDRARVAIEAMVANGDLDPRARLALFTLTRDAPRYRRGPAGEMVAVPAVREWTFERFGSIPADLPHESLLPEQAPRLAIEGRFTLAITLDDDGIAELPGFERVARMDPLFPGAYRWLHEPPGATVWRARR